MSPLAESNLQDPTVREGVLDLLGALAYGELVGFFQIVNDAERAPQMSDRTALAGVAIAEYGQYELLVARIRELDGDPEELMTPFAPGFDAWHQHTRAGSWLEGLMKVYAGTSLATDFYREIARYVDPRTRDLVEEVLGSSEHARFAQERLSEAIARDPAVAGRLALFGRRMMGEALSQAQRVATDHEPLTALLLEGAHSAGADLAELTAMFSRLTDRHRERMTVLGLSA